MAYSTSNSEKGKCVSCGFLAIDSTHEVPRHIRETGWCAIGSKPDYGELLTISCFVEEAMLFPDPAKYVPVDRNEKQFFPPKEILTVLHADRECPSWYPFKPKYGPKEHLEMLRNEEIELKRQEHDIAIAQMVKESHQAHIAVTEGIKSILGETREIFKDIKPLMVDLREITQSLVPIVGHLKTTTESLKGTVEKMDTTVGQMEVSSTKIGKFSIGLAVLAILITVASTVLQLWLATRSTPTERLLQSIIDRFSQ